MNIEWQCDTKNFDQYLNEITWKEVRVIDYHKMSKISLRVGKWRENILQILELIICMNCFKSQKLILWQTINDRNEF